MESHNPKREYCLTLVVRSTSALDVLLQLVQGLEWAEFLDEVLEGTEHILVAKLRYEECRILGFAGVPADDDELLGAGVGTWSLHLMIWMCLKAKYPSSRGYYRFINYITPIHHPQPSPKQNTFPFGNHQYSPGRPNKTSIYVDPNPTNKAKIFLRGTLTIFIDSVCVFCCGMCFVSII